MSFTDWWWADREDMRYWPPYARLIWQQLNEIHAMLRRGGGGGDNNERIAMIEQKVDVVINELRAFRREDREGDVIMSAETQAAIDELMAEVTPLTDSVTAVETTVDKLLAMFEGAGDDPVQIRAVTANIRAERARIVAAALKGTVADPTPSGM